MWAANSDRLQRLVYLIESGPSSSVRERAAQQLPTLQQDISCVLDRLHPLLAHVEWTVREAAAKGVSAMAAATPAWCPDLQQSYQHCDTGPCVGTGTGTGTGASAACCDTGPCVVTGTGTRAGAGAGVDTGLNASTDAGGGANATTGAGMHPKAEPTSDSEAGSEEEAEHGCSALRFSSKPEMRIAHVLRHGVPLLASCGAEFDPPPLDVTNARDMSQWIEQQQRQLRKRLGLLDDPRGQPSLPEFIEVKDVQPAGVAEAAAPAMAAPDTNATDSAAATSTSMSVRQMYQAKRRARQRKKSRSGAFARFRPLTSVSKAPAATTVAPEPMTASACTCVSMQREPITTVRNKSPAPAIDAFCTAASYAMFDSRWQTRHGALLALVQVLKSHAWSIGATSVLGTSNEHATQLRRLRRQRLRQRGQLSPLPQDTPAAGTKQSRWKAFQIFMEDTAFRAVSVLALDRFCDFSGGGSNDHSKETIAPVREAAAHLLGVVVMELDKARLNANLSCLVSRMAVALLAMLPICKGVEEKGEMSTSCIQAGNSQQWEVRFGALLGIQALLCAPLSRETSNALKKILVPKLVPWCCAALQFDEYDEVRALAAACLLPLAQFSRSPDIAVSDARAASWQSCWDSNKPLLVHTLWLCLREIDVLSYHARPVMQVLRLMYVQSSRGVQADSMVSEMGKDLNARLPPVSERLSYVLDALSSSVHVVRVAAIELIGELLPFVCADKLSGVTLASFVTMILRYLFWHLLIEHCRTSQSDTANTLVPQLLKLWTESLPVLFAAYSLEQGTICRNIKLLLAISATTTGTPMLATAAEFLGDGNTHHGFEKMVIYSADGCIASVSMRVVAAQAIGDLLVQCSIYNAASVHELAECLAIQYETGGSSSEQRFVNLLVAAQWTSTAVTFRESDTTLFARFPCGDAVVQRYVQAEAALNTTMRREYDMRERTVTAIALVACRQCTGNVMDCVVRDLLGAIEMESELILQAFAARALSWICGQSTIEPLRENILLRLLQLNCPETAQTRLSSVAGDDSTVQRNLMIAQAGSRAALREIASHCGHNLFDNFPTLWHMVCSTAHTPPQASNPGQPCNDVDVDHAARTEANDMSEIVQVHLLALWAMSSMLPSLSARLHAIVFKCIGGMAQLLGLHPAHTTAAGMIMLGVCQLDTSRGIIALLQHIVPRLENMSDDAVREAAATVVNFVVQSMSETDAKLSLVTVLLLPCVRAMNDPCEAVRQPSGACFARLAKLAPLVLGDNYGRNRDGVATQTWAQDSDESSIHDAERQGRELLTLLVEGGKGLHLDMSRFLEPDVTLRPYQQDGVNWLWNLHRFGLHGILCDEMGLGKTLQTLCVIVSSIEQEQSCTSAVALDKRGPSLIVCPSTLSEHWKRECDAFFPSRANVIVYSGSPSRRAQLRQDLAQKQVTDRNRCVVVTAYGILRQDVELLLAVIPSWNFVVLDEGHLVKNNDTATSRSVKKLRARHRLIVTGTPIQNNLLELWSLFDFLLPGLLGTKAEFHAGFGRHVRAAADPKASRKMKAAAAAALEVLHECTRPFLLRRTKAEVLRDLPPKIVQDYCCELSPLQARWYSQLSRPPGADTGSNDGIASCAADVAWPASHDARHLTILQDLQQLCQHPSLVADKAPSELRNGESAANLHSSGKLTALFQLLQSCLGSEACQSSSSSAAGQPQDSQHRCLVFAQHLAVLDLVEKLVLRPHFPNVKYLRLDGSSPVPRRADLVRQFNEQSGISLMLLTTKVGGFGLNLTGADVVIFIEHDWNPMNDLQAMDRAHRIGQTRTVQVFRLIAKDTIEERILGLQQFKLKVASAVVRSGGSAGTGHPKPGVIGDNNVSLLDTFAQSSSVLPSRHHSRTSSTSFGPEDMLDEFGHVRKRARLIKDNNNVQNDLGMEMATEYDSFVASATTTVSTEPSPNVDYQK